jgi:outer membrane protein OmpA-like peptidoglycan-associated protein
MRRWHAALMVAALSACAVPAPQVTGQRFVVYFQQWSAAIDPGAQNAIDAAIARAKQTGLKPVLVQAFADPTGSKQANIYMTETRAQMVTDALEAGGVDAARIRQDAEGATGPVPDLQASRRVVVIVGD